MAAVCMSIRGYIVARTLEFGTEPTGRLASCMIAPHKLVLCMMALSVSGSSSSLHKAPWLVFHSFCSHHMKVGS